MTQAQTAPRENVEMTFKRFILKETSAYAHEPQADLFRVNLLGQMLDRHDELLRSGLGEVEAGVHVRHEFYDIADRMAELGFEPMDVSAEYATSVWPLLTEDEAAEYISQRDAYLHKKSLGIAMCTSCVTPVMIGALFSDLLYSDFFALLGLVGMFMMIALGVYSIVMAKKPQKDKKIGKGRFSLGYRLRRKLMDLCEAMEEKTRRRRGKGIALLVGCVVPIFVGAAFYELFYSDFWSIIGVAGMFVMIGAGVYELVMAAGEKKTMKHLLKIKE